MYHELVSSTVNRTHYQSTTSDIKIWRLYQVNHTLYHFLVDFSLSVCSQSNDRINLSQTSWQHRKGVLVRLAKFSHRLFTSKFAYNRVHRQTETFEYVAMYYYDNYDNMSFCFTVFYCHTGLHTSSRVIMYRLCKSSFERVFTKMLGQ